MFTERRTSLTKRSLQGILCLFSVTYMVLLATIYMVFYFSKHFRSYQNHFYSKRLVTLSIYIIYVMAIEHTFTINVCIVSCNFKSRW